MALGSIIGAVIGGGLSFLGSKASASSQERAAESAGQASVQAAQIQADLARELARDAAFPNITAPGLGGATFDPESRNLIASLDPNIGTFATGEAANLRNQLAFSALSAFQGGLGLNPAQQAEIDRQRAGLQANLFGRGRLGLLQGGAGSVTGNAFQPELATFQEGVTRGILQEERAGQSQLLQSYLAALGAELDLRETPLRLITGAAGARGQAGAAPTVDSSGQQSGILAAGTTRARGLDSLFGSLGLSLANAFSFGQGNFGFSGGASDQGVNRFGQAALLNGEPIPF